jgi:ATP-dependent Clp protease ATP-binding subunit ClpX
MEKKTGARALRSIFEKAMLGVMYDIPSHPEIAEVVVGAETIIEGKSPKLVTHAEKKKAG